MYYASFILNPHDLSSAEARITERHCLILQARRFFSRLFKLVLTAQYLKGTSPSEGMNPK